MAISYDEAVAQVTGAGSLFETQETETPSGPLTVFKHAPPNLKALFDIARTRGDVPFLVYEDECWSFGDVMRSVDALGALLVERYGLKKGDRVAIGMRNYPEWVISFAGILSVGGVSVSLNAWWTEDELDYALEDSGARVLIADPERLDRAKATCERLGIQRLGVRLGDAPPGGVDRWDDLPLGSPLPAVEIGAADDATILYTSGTTGRPKGAVSTHSSVVQALTGFACRAAVDTVRKAASSPVPDAAPDSDPAQRAFILIVPLFHVTGCVPVMLSCFIAGLKLVMMYKWDPERALELIERERVTNFVGVPTQSWDLLECPRFPEFDTSSLESVGGGGAPAPPELVKRVDENFSKARPGIGYGMTETNAYGPQNSGDDYRERPTSTGRGTPILKIAVRDEEGRDLPPGERGEIWFRGPNLIRGYWNRPDATAETIVDGWLRTGDIGRIDADGFVYVEDRAKDMILRGGENVYCAEVEAAIYEHPDVYEAAVFGVPHERLGEQVATVVLRREGTQLDVEGLRKHVRERLAPFKVPEIVVFRDEPLPRNPAGKVLKRDLRDEIVGS